jgi:hypothetical protein
MAAVCPQGPLPPAAAGRHFRSRGCLRPLRPHCSGGRNDQHGRLARPTVLAFLRRHRSAPGGLLLPMLLGAHARWPGGAGFSRSAAAASSGRSPRVSIRIMGQVICVGLNSGRHCLSRRARSCAPRAPLAVPGPRTSCAAPLAGLCGCEFMRLCGAMNGTLPLRRGDRPVRRTAVWRMGRMGGSDFLR